MKRLPLRIEEEVEANRIENVSQHARQRHQPNAGSRWQRDAIVGEVLCDVLDDATHAEIEMIVITQRIQIEVIATEQSKIRQVIKHKVHEEQLVAKPMPLRQQPLMHDIAVVKAGGEGRGHGREVGE
jgi:hypothetical protein